MGPSGESCSGKDLQIDELGGVVIGERELGPGSSPVFIVLNRAAPSDDPSNETKTYFAFDNGEYFFVQQDEGDPDRYLLTGGGLGEAVFAAITVFGFVPHPIILSEVLRQKGVYPPVKRCPDCGGGEVARFWYFPEFDAAPAPGMDYCEVTLFRGTCNCVPDISLCRTHLGAVRGWNAHVEMIESTSDGTVS